MAKAQSWAPIVFDTDEYVIVRSCLINRKALLENNLKLLNTTDEEKYEYRKEVDIIHTMLRREFYAS